MAIHRFGAAAIFAGVAVLMVAGCQTSEQVSRPRPRPPGPIVQPPGPAEAMASAAAYIATAASIDLFEIQSSQLVLSRSRHVANREFAEMMIRAHNGTSAQLSMAGRRLNLLPPAIMQPRHQAMLAELSASGNFDATYRRQQIAVHQEALRLHSNYAQRGASPTLRPVAANAVPIVSRHLRMLGYM
jgi:putative membrane protein